METVSQEVDRRLEAVEIELKKENKRLKAEILALPEIKLNLS